MSLHLPEQKLGSHSNAGSSSHKFMLKGRQTGSMHRGHAWVFRAESHDTMLAWYEDIKNLTEKTGEERNAFVRKHARSMSAGSHKAPSVSSDGILDEDEADQIPYSADASVNHVTTQPDQQTERPQPGGRFPSDLNVNRDLQVPLSPSSGTSSGDHEVIAAAGALPGHASRSVSHHAAGADAENHPQTNGPDHESPLDVTRDSVSRATTQRSYVPIAQKEEYNNLPVQEGPLYVPIAQQSEYNNLPVQKGPFNFGPQKGEEYNAKPVHSHGLSSEGSGAVAYATPKTTQEHTATSLPYDPVRHESNYGEWMAPAATGVAAGAVGAEAYQHQHQDTLKEESQIPQAVESTETARPVLSSVTIPRGESFMNPRTPPPIESSQSDSLMATPIPTSDPRQSWIGGDDTTADTLSQAEAQSSDGPSSGRPGLTSEKSEQTVSTVSDLHIPGEFPRPTATGA